jgi:hypothetical protein
MRRQRPLFATWLLAAAVAAAGARLPDAAPPGGATTADRASLDGLRAAVQAQS